MNRASPPREILYYGSNRQQQYWENEAQTLCIVRDISSPMWLAYSKQAGVYRLLPAQPQPKRRRSRNATETVPLAGHSAEEVIARLRKNHRLHLFLEQRLRRWMATEPVAAHGEAGVGEKLDDGLDAEAAAPRAGSTRVGKETRDRLDQIPTVTEPQAPVPDGGAHQADGQRIVESKPAAELRLWPVGLVGIRSLAATIAAAAATFAIAGGLGLIGPDGAEMPSRLEGEAESRAGTRVIALAEARQNFRFVDVPAPPVPSLLRDFSAPVRLQGVPLDRLKFLAIHDSDPVARWDAGQQVATRMLLDGVAAHQVTPAALPPIDPDVVAAMRETLADAERDPAFAAEALALPLECKASRRVRSFVIPV